MSTRLKVTVFHRHSYDGSGDIDSKKVIESLTEIVEEDFHIAWEKAKRWIYEERVGGGCSGYVNLGDPKSKDLCSSEIREISP